MPSGSSDPRSIFWSEKSTSHGELKFIQMTQTWENADTAFHTITSEETQSGEIDGWIFDSGL